MTKNENTEAVRARILALIESEYESDAAFERAIGLPDKTVNNWRRARSASFMRMLPRLGEAFRVSLSQLMDVPLSEDNRDLSEDEIHLLRLYRRTRPMPTAMRKALAETLESTVKLYLDAYVEIKKEEKKPRVGRKAPGRQ